MKPSVGRIVHYVSYGTPAGEFTSKCRAAVVTEVEKSGDVDQERASICVLNPTGVFFHEGAIHAEDRRPGSWHWPERIPE
jgi:hypothetical protein